MKESHFVEQNKEKWNEFEADLKSKKKDPEKIRKLFIEITDDLSFARTFYKSRLVNNYLNGVAQLLFQEIYKNETGPANQFKKFWTTELPLYLYQARKELLISFLVFVGAMAIGVFSAMHDPEFTTMIMGESYITMTEENIAKDDPMAVYKDERQLGMFLGITMNNIKVAFMTFLSGILASIGTLAVIIYNGVMLGAFQYFFIERGLFWESFLTIWQHGALEISSIVIAGAAGITLGKGLIFPGTYTRSISFRLSARRGLKILAGVVPLFIIAGFIEGFITRYTDMNNGIRLANILVSFSFIVFYYVWYPRRVYLSNPDLAVPESPPHHPDKMAFDKRQVNSGSKIIGLALQKVGGQLIPLLKWGFGASLILTLLVMLISQGIDRDLINNLMYYEGFDALSNLEKRPYLALVYFLLFASASGTSMYFLEREELSKNSLITNIRHMMPYVGLSSLILSLVFLFNFFWGILFLILFTPFLSAFISGSLIWRESFATVLSRSTQYTLSNWMTLGEVILKIGVIVFLLSFTFTSQIYTFYMSTVDILFYSESQFYDLAYLGLSTSLFFTYLFMSVVLFSYCSHYLLYTNQEIQTGAHLKDRIRQVGVRNRILGMDQE
ncbi:stage II sporulation protein M [bacterium SCSIO 12741]|nr:stage II sporulation protein M [bacterium SCSIO 12741]